MRLKLFLVIFIFSNVTQAVTPVSFDEALAQILERSTEIKVQQTQVNAAGYGVTQTKGAFLPNLSLSGQRGDGTTNGVYTPPSQSVSATASINIFKWGVDIHNLEGAKENFHSQQEALENSKLIMEQTAVEVLSFRIQTGQEIEVLKKNAETFHLYLEIAQQRFSHGLLPSQEVDKVSLDYSNAEARLQDAISRHALSKANLARYLGKESEVKDEWPWKVKLTSESLSKILEITPNFSDRPDIRSALSAVSSEGAKLKSGYWSQYPSLDFSIGQGYSQNQDGSGQNSTTSLSLSLPLFDKLAYYSKYKIQYENYAAADLKLRQLKLDAESEWTAAKEQFTIALKTATDRDKSLDISQRLYQSNDLRFKQGRATANDLEVDHRRLIDASLLAIAGWSAAHIQFTKFCHSLGRPIKSCYLVQ